ncbi:glycosyltransferase family 4 protein [bacterium]|nr:glycosyltransferase family 4 protein [bacterium]
MKVLHLTPIYAPSYSGSALHFQRLSETLASRGHEVSVITANALDYRAFWVKSLPVNNLAAKEVINGVQVKRLPVCRRHSSKSYWRLVHYSWKYRLPGSDWLRTWYDGPILRGIGEAARGDFDIVCAGLTPSMMVVYGRRIADKLGVPYVVIPGLHTDNPFNTERANIARILRSADHVCPSTTFERDVLISDFAIDPDKISVAGCGVNPTDFDNADGLRFRSKHGIPADAPIVLFVGAEVAHKGLLVLVEAMRAVWSEYPEAFLVIAGVRSSASEQLNRILTEDKSLAQRVIRCSSFDDSEKADIFDACDVFAMPSWSESFGIVYLEAWMRSKPVIGCRGGAVETVISHNQDGILVDPKNSSDLTQALLKLLGDANLRARLGANGKKKTIEYHTWDKVTDRLQEAYRSLGVK